MFERIKDFYNRKLYTKVHIRGFTGAKIITPEQYEEITGEEYIGV